MFMLLLQLSLAGKDMRNWTIKGLRWAKLKQSLSSAVLLYYSGTPVIQYGSPRTQILNVTTLYHVAWHWMIAEKHSNLGGWQSLYIHRTVYSTWAAYSTSFSTLPLPKYHWAPKILTGIQQYCKLHSHKKKHNGIAGGQISIFMLSVITS